MKLSKGQRLFLIEEIIQEVIRVEGKNRGDSIYVDFRNKDELLGTYPYQWAIKYLAGEYWQDAEACDISEVNGIGVHVG